MMLNLLPRFLNDHWFSNWSSSAQDVGYIPLLFFRNGKLKPISRNTNFKLALMSSPRFSGTIWVLNSDWLSDSILNGDWLYFHMWRMLFAKLIGRIALFTCENIAHIEFYLQGLLPKIRAIYTIKSLSYLLGTPRRISGSFVSPWVFWLGYVRQNTNHSATKLPWYAAQVSKKGTISDSVTTWHGLKWGKLNTE